MDKTRLCFAFAAANVLLLAGCGDGGVDAPEIASPPIATAPANAVAAPPAQTADAGERSALGVLNAINDHEIAVSQQAIAKGVTGAVADYAQQMIDVHARNREATLAMNPDAGSLPAQLRAEKGAEKRAGLAARDGLDYQQAYVQAMVADHLETLAALDAKLIPAARSPDVEAHLRATREHVAAHLKQAQQLRIELATRD